MKKTSTYLFRCRELMVGENQYEILWNPFRSSFEEIQVIEIVCLRYRFQGELLFEKIVVNLGGNAENMSSSLLWDGDFFISKSIFIYWFCPILQFNLNQFISSCLIIINIVSKNYITIQGGKRWNYLFQDQLMLNQMY